MFTARVVTSHGSHMALLSKWSSFYSECYYCAYWFSLCWGYACNILCTYMSLQLVRCSSKNAVTWIPPTALHKIPYNQHECFGWCSSMIWCNFDVVAFSQITRISICFLACKITWAEFEIIYWHIRWWWSWRILAFVDTRFSFVIVSSNYTTDFIMLPSCFVKLECAEI
jgi:hypothetical protein